MSWLRIDDRFEEHEKVDTLSDAAHRLWFRCACWCKKPENEHLDGFVPLRIVAKLAGSPALATEALERACRGARRGGLRPRARSMGAARWRVAVPRLGRLPTAEGLRATNPHEFGAERGGSKGRTSIC